ncbi:uncharacterized protein LOC116304478 [Actinia tenebrosa]|uniref:Uncharacterized protein LOC116304478 n=1 Tax=Actinia tenebrosa TaxID=6105 RepID=A0A6P8IVC2_ACTTE|nr:uncharacterized protein LOC116304478 [Actinia tenebrosa]
MPEMFATCALVALLVSFPCIRGSVFDSGKAYLNNTLPNDPGCTDVLFVSRFKPNQDIRVITSLSHSDLLRSVHDPAALWVKQVTSRGFRVCVRESGVGSNGTGVVNWIAVQGTVVGLQHGSITFDQLGSGTQCKAVPTQLLYLKPPQVFATVVAPDSSTRQDAMNVWVTKNKIGGAYSVCLREMVSFDGVHSQLKVNWIAYQKMSSKMNVTETNNITIDTRGTSVQQIDYTFCKNVNFKNEFFSPPVVVTTASYYSNDSRPVAQECKAMSVWIEEITKTYFRVCARELKDGRSKTSIMNLDYIVQGDLDPCINVSCNYFAVCKAFAPKDARCVCVDDCPSYEEQVCSSNGTTFKNKCFFELEMCRLKSNHTLYHPGSCTGFPLERGRTSLSSTPVDGTMCKEVRFRPFAFYPDKRVHVHLTVNHFNTTNLDYVHDAMASWVENVNYQEFTACMTMAGRSVRPRVAQATFDWFAYQGAPDGGVTDRTRLDEWWTGTTCKTVKLPKDKFTSVPTVIVTAEHISAAFKHDAANLWLENVNQTSFEVCLRELQNFDGLHENIHVSWMAFEEIHRPLFSEKGKVLFPNTGKPSMKYNGAFCKDLKYSKVYEHVPTVILSTNHTTASGNSRPVCNGVSTWIEYMNTTGFRVCVKELYTTKYEPLTVSYLLLSEICYPGWNYFDGICYHTSSSCDTWINAENRCTTSRAHLATIKSQIQNVYIQQRLNGAKGWIGLNDKSVESVFRWTQKGLQNNWTYWAENQPNNAGDQDCVHTLGVDHQYHWNDVSCNECHNFTCQKDLDECRKEAFSCHDDAVCRNTYGSYYCQCKTGYTGNGKQCTDIDECTTDSPCHVNATCINIPGSYVCRCKNGYSGDGFSCSDINECATNTHHCDRNAYCNNTEGSYRCTCNRGYYGNGTKCTTSRGLDSSAILTTYGNADYLRTLSGYLYPVLQSSSRSHWIRCWRAATDGWNVRTTFHPQCDGKGPTVTIVRVGSHVFGGYTDVSWQTGGNYYRSSRSFLYSLYNTNGYSPIKLTFNRHLYYQYAIYGINSYGPTFGGGHDLHISNYASSNTNSYTNLGHTYRTPQICSYGSGTCRSFMAGTYNFCPNDIEVFYETTN